MGPLLSQLSAQIGQLASQAGLFICQELSKPHNQAHLAKAIDEILKSTKKKK